jgi:alpha-beta hydrolase superfamily lysophospholipase
MNPGAGPVPACGIEVRYERGGVLPGRVWCAPNPRALIAVLHGLGEHSGLYAALAGDLVKARFTVVALDLPGHGEAPGGRGDMPSWIQVRDQIVPLLFTAARGLPDQPLEMPRVLLGHSMGGVMALDFALTHPRQILAVVASAPGLKSEIPPWWKLALANVARVTSPAAGFPHGLDESGMSRDPEVLAGRKTDRLVHDRISPRLYFAFEEARQRVMREARRLAVPTLLLHGAADRVVDPKGSLAFSAAAPHDLCRLLTYRDAYHELFNDPARDLAVRDLTGWLDAVLVT